MLWLVYCSQSIILRDLRVPLYGLRNTHRSTQNIRCVSIHRGIRGGHGAPCSTVQIQQLMRRVTDSVELRLLVVHCHCHRMLPQLPEPTHTEDGCEDWYGASGIWKCIFQCAARTAGGGDFVGISGRPSASNAWLPMGPSFPTSPGIKLKGWDLKGPQTNMSYLVEFLQANDLCNISSMRARTPGKFVNFQDITHDPPPSSPTLDTYSVLDHILCNISHQSYFQFIQSLTHIMYIRHFTSKSE